MAACSNISTRSNHDLPQSRHPRENPHDFVEVSPELAREQVIESGSLVQLTSRHRAPLHVPALVTDGSTMGNFYADELHRNPVNRLTNSKLIEKYTHTPAFKETAVNMTVLPERGANPLPRENFRHGHPTSSVGRRGSA